MDGNGTRGFVRAQEPEGYNSKAEFDINENYAEGEDGKCDGCGNAG